MSVPLWTVLAAAALLWPARVIGALDGIPLDGRLEALAIGVAVPTLWYLDRRFLERRAPRVAVIALLAVKAAGTLLLTQQGVCARFSTNAPLAGVSNSIPIEESTGSLRSWDVRADWREAAPRCTAIFARSYDETAAFPAWFLNLVDVIRPERRNLMLDVSGSLNVAAAGVFTVETGPGMEALGRIGDTAVSAAPGEPIAVTIAPGVHALDLHVSLEGRRWRFMPLWNGSPAWTMLTISSPTRWDRLASGPLAFAGLALVVLIVAGWANSALTSLKPTLSMAAWTVAAAATLVCVGWTGRFERFAGPLLLTSVFLPVATRHRNLRGAFVLLGVPWLALFVSRSAAQIGHVTAYSFDDDWLIFQTAAYRIFLNGYWLEGGSPTFYFQPFYRWTSGLLHLVFGDSSVGEVYWDAACLIAAALLAFQIVKANVSFRAGLAAGAATLATCTLGTVWHLIGRGLSEISAAGWAALAGFFLLRARIGRASAAVTAGVCATLMFYTRLNHLVFGFCLLFLLLPLTTSSRIDDAWAARARVRWRSAALYAGTFAAGLVMFAWRTWWYTGAFSLFHGTSLHVQETGLRLSTLGSPVVWARTSESLRALIWMNEPPAPDLRALPVAAGVLLSIAALLQLPAARRLPFVGATLCIGASIGAFVAHAHHYPGRLSIHLVPFAVAMTVCAIAMAVRFAAGRIWRAAGRQPAAA